MSSTTMLVANVLLFSFVIFTATILDARAFPVWSTFQRIFLQPAIPKFDTPSEGKVQIGYFTGWGIYNTTFRPKDIDTSKLTHILYAFGDITKGGRIKFIDPYADEQMHYPNDNCTWPDKNLHGNLLQLFQLKMANRNLKVSLSIGGWTASHAGHYRFVKCYKKRAIFVKDAVRTIEDYGFDGIDLDFEFPQNDDEGQGFADLLTELRVALNELAARKGDTTPYELSASVAIGHTGYDYLKVPQMDKALNYWSLMAYDYAGTWLDFTSHHANLMPGTPTGMSTDGGVKHYLYTGATRSKLVMGIPLYGRAFEDTDGLNSAYHGIGPGNIGEPGTYSYKTLPFEGAKVIEDLLHVASYSYDPVKRELVSYDNPKIVQLKSQYINEHGMGGSMFWDISLDKVGPDSLVNVAYETLGPLQQIRNHLNYPKSKWVNIRTLMTHPCSKTD